MGRFRPFRLTPAERRGFIVLLIAICLVVGGRLYFVRNPLGNSGDMSLTDKEMKELLTFERRVKADSVERSRKYEKVERRAELFLFDPNTADSLTFIRLGLKSWQASNALKYRRKGGRWHKADDFARLYGLKRETFERLRPYIRIGITPEEAKIAYEQMRRDSLHKAFKNSNPKFPQGTVVDLNEADTTMLKRIPGIGSYYAGKICRYRERLGGFISVEQVKEIEGLPGDISKWFKVQASPQVVKIELNKADFKTLVRHPYLSYEQVKVIVDYRRKHGRLKSWKELRLYKEFKQDDFSRLSPYFKF